MVDFLPDLLAAYFDNRGFIQKAICKCLEGRISFSYLQKKKLKALMKEDSSTPSSNKEFFKSFFPQVEKLISEDGFMIKVMCNMVEIYFQDTPLLDFSKFLNVSSISLQDLRKFVLSGYEAQIEYTESIINTFKNTNSKKKSSRKVTETSSLVQLPAQTTNIDQSLKIEQVEPSSVALITVAESVITSDAIDTPVVELSKDSSDCSPSSTKSYPTLNENVKIGSNLDVNFPSSNSLQQEVELPPITLFSVVKSTTPITNVSDTELPNITGIISSPSTKPMSVCVPPPKIRIQQFNSSRPVENQNPLQQDIIPISSLNELSNSTSSSGERIVGTELLFNSGQEKIFSHKYPFRPFFPSNSFNLENFASGYEEYSNILSILKDNNIAPFVIKYITRAYQFTQTFNQLNNKLEMQLLNESFIAEKLFKQDSTIKIIQQTNKEQKAELKKQEIIIQELNSKVQYQNIVIQKQEATIQDLNSKVQYQNIVIQKQETTIQELNSKVQYQNIVIKKQEATIQDLNSKVQYQNIVIQKQEATIQDLNSKVQYQNIVIQKQETTIQDLNSKINIILATNKEQSDKIQQLEAKIDNILKQFQITQSPISTSSCNCTCTGCSGCVHK